LRPVARKPLIPPVMPWDPPVCEQFFRIVGAVVWALPPGKQIRVLPGAARMSGNVRDGWRALKSMRIIYCCGTAW